MSKIKTKTRPRAKSKPAGLDDRKARLAEVARLGQLFLDGDQMTRLLSEQGYLWTNADDLDYNHEPFIVLKKTVLRLEQSPADDVPVYVNLWRQRPDDQAKGEPLVAGMKVSAFGIGEKNRAGIVPMPASLRAAILNGRTASETHPKGAVSVFAPLYDSLHHIVGAIEAFDDPQS